MTSQSQGPDRRALLIALNACPQLSRETICRLAAREPPIFGPDSNECSDGSGRAPVGRRSLSIAAALTHNASPIATRELALAEQAGASVVTILDEEFPGLLRDLELPPPVLYIRGALPKQPAIAIVGSRQADPYGREAAEMFGRELAASGLEVVSGLARGIDTAAHLGALSSPGGRTLAVQGCGIDIIYPKRNSNLAQRISDNGGVISEFPIGSAPLPRNFPIRNRLIAGLAVATLVIQAAPRSGSLITARLAGELGRDVFAVPGTIFHPRAIGTNSLLADGALVACCTRDILEALPIGVQDRLRPATEEAPPEAAGPAGEIVNALALHQTLSPEELARLLSRTVAEVLAPLLELEVAGLVRRYPGPVFHLRR
jgi:DNA processing protein